MIDNETIKKSIDYYGKEKQSVVCMEECSELIQAISKELRGKTDIEHLAEEIADVLISIEVLKQIYSVPQSAIYDWINYKQARVLERIKGDKAYEKFKHMPDCEKEAETTKHNIDDWILEETELAKHYAENKMKFVELLEQLKEYQQLEEMGRLINLPCKVGDTVWSIDGNNKLSELVINIIDIHDNHIYYFVDDKLTRLTYVICDDEFSHVVFLTKSEADAKLKELRGNQNGKV